MKNKQQAKTREKTPFFTISVQNADQKSSDPNSKYEQVEDECLTSFLEDKSEPLLYKCSKCTQSYNEEHDLQLHESTHTSDLKCIRCNKEFISKIYLYLFSLLFIICILDRQKLRRHIKIHMIYKAHICQKCGKSYSESRSLTEHLRKHDGIPRDKKYSCNVCSQRFSEPFYLNIHMRKHTGERPLKCMHCSKSFADPRSLKAHSMIHTGENLTNVIFVRMYIIFN